ncbi:MAG: CapA family protein [Chloroflexota bacterium]|nr:CapA family protein [Chloroflexota bacterium]
MEDGNDREISVALVGDVMLQTPLADLPGARHPAFRAAVDELGRSDIAVANLEMPLSTGGYRVPKHSNLRSDPAIADDVRALGVHAVTLANNHLMDYGPPALFDTLAASDRAGLLRCGAGADLDEADRPAWLIHGGRRVALLSVACTLPVESDAGPGKPGIAPLRVGFSFEIDANLLVEQPGTMPVVRSWTVAADQERVCSRIAVLKAEADAVLVAIHWGVPPYWLSPYQGLLAEYQQPLGRALIDAGADLVCGHHSHTLHPIEVYRGKLILYSLGNFIFETPRAFMEPESVVARAVFGPEPALELAPLLLDEVGLPRLTTGEAADHVLDLLARLSRPFGTELEIGDGRARVVAG